MKAWSDWWNNSSPNDGVLQLILELLQRDGASDSKEVQEQLSAVRLLDTPETPDEVTTETERKLDPSH